MSVNKGVKVRVVNADGSHGFDVGDVVTSTGKPWGETARGYWDQFDSQCETYSQYLLAEHYELVAPVVEPVKAEQLKGVIVQEDGVPTKAIYGVVNKYDEIWMTTDDRDHARDIKADLGGKRKGVRIFQYAAVKEIR